MQLSILLEYSRESTSMHDLNDYWTRRRALIEECNRCDESNRFLILACPLYLFFPVFLLFVIPLFILFKRIRFLAMRQLLRDQEKFCTLISGQQSPKTITQLGAKL